MRIPSILFGAVLAASIFSAVSRATGQTRPVAPASTRPADRLSPPASDPAARPLVFHSKRNAYTLAFPPDWWEMPDEVRKISTGLVNPEAQRRFNIEAVFHRGHPFRPDAMVRIQVVQYPFESEPDEEQMRQIAHRFAIPDQAAAERDLTDAGRRLLANTKTTEPVLDTARRTFTYHETAPANSGEPLEREVVGYFGHSAMVAVSFIAPTSKFSKYQPEFRQIQDSFRFDPAAAYQGSGPALRKLLWILGAAVLGVVYLVFRFTYGRRRRT